MNELKNSGIRGTAGVCWKAHLVDVVASNAVSVITEWALPALEPLTRVRAHDAREAGVRVAVTRHSSTSVARPVALVTIRTLAAARSVVGVGAGHSGEAGAVVAVDAATSGSRAVSEEARRTRSALVSSAIVATTDASEAWRVATRQQTTAVARAVASHAGRTRTAAEATCSVGARDSAVARVVATRDAQTAALRAISTETCKRCTCTARPIVNIYSV